MPEAATREEMKKRFAWNIPGRCRIGEDVCNKWADGSGRRANSGATVLVTDGEGLRKIEGIRHALPVLRHVFCVDEDAFPGDGLVAELHEHVRTRLAAHQCSRE